MSLTEEWKMGKSLEWITKLPLFGQPCKSPVFLIRNTECCFEFYKYIGHYEVFLRPKTLFPTIESFPLVIYSDCYAPGNLQRSEREFLSPDHCLYQFPETYFSARPLDLNHGHIVRFFFVFEFGHTCRPLLKKTKDNEVQTPLYIDTNFQLEGISKDFSSLLDGGLNHDVEFTCGDQLIKAHKNILCCRSEVFASMLRADMIEGKTGRVKIQDMEGSVFRKFLRCLYTGMLPELTADIAVQFYEASDKYAVDALKKLSSNFLVENLTPENACEILIIADRHGDSDFKKGVTEYMMRKKIPLMEEKWTDFCKENPTLAIEVLNLHYQHLSVNSS